MDLGTIRQISIDTEMQASYLDYAMSVIVARALPDVRDGLKPVHRRILYAMHDLGLTNDKPYKKSARIVGEVLGKYHPHGDAAVYEAMVRMAQDFSLRYPLVDGQGNFGSIDGDNAAAMRYTEARLAAISAEMLADIEKDTVEWTDNFDGTLREPVVLPAALPNLLINGSSGIAVGMATNIPPHNLGEVCDALVYLIDNYDRAEDVTVEDLTQYIQGPDFPTGGVIYRYQKEGNGADAQQVDVIAKAYAGGRGPIVVQAKAHIEEMSRNRNRIVVTELPYQTDKTRLLERIAELAREGRLEGLTDLRDESDRTGMRINIELTRNVDPRKVLAELYRLTPLQMTFGVSLLALVDGEPRLLSLKRILIHYLEHRQDVIVRRSKYELERARKRAHILEGLLRALDVLDEIIALIRRSRTVDTARQNLIDQFKFTEIQAQAILDMQLRRLAALERRKLQDEYKETLALIKELEALLASPQKVLALIKQNLIDLRARYADSRRTQIADRVKGTLTAHDILPDQDVWIRLSGDGLLGRERRTRDLPLKLGRSTTAPWRYLPANTRQDLLLFSAKGQVTRIQAHQIPESPGAHFADLSGFNRRDRVVGMHAFHKLAAGETQPGFLVLGTVRGQVKRVALADVFSQLQANPQVIGLDNGDELLWTAVSQGGGEFLLFTASGQAIRFAEDDVRAMGLPAGGIGGIKLRAKDRVVAGVLIESTPAPETGVAIVTAGGYAKQVPLVDFPAQGRNGQGVVAIKLAGRSGEVVGAGLLLPAWLLVCNLEGGASIAMAARDVPGMGRPAQGKQVVKLASSERVLSAYSLECCTPVEEPEDEEPQGRRGAATGDGAKPGTRKRQATAGDAGAAESRKRAAASAPEPARRRASASGQVAQPVAAQMAIPGLDGEVSEKPAGKGRRKVAEPSSPPAAARTSRTAKAAAVQKALVPDEAGAAPAASTRARRATGAATDEKKPARSKSRQPEAVAEPASKTPRRAAARTAKSTAPAVTAVEPDPSPAPTKTRRAAAKAPDPVSRTRTAKSTATSTATALKPEAPAAPAKTRRAAAKPSDAVSAAASETSAAKAQKRAAQTASTPPASAKGKTAAKKSQGSKVKTQPDEAPKRPRVSAADGPMTWPVVPSTHGDEVPEPPPAGPTGRPLSRQASGTDGGKTAGAPASKPPVSGKTERGKSRSR